MGCESPPSPTKKWSRLSASRIGRRRVAAKEDASEVYQKRRKEIAEAAVRVFNRLGFAGASISAVAAELDIDRASLYYYIGSKEELFDELIREVTERNSQTVRGLAAGTQSPAHKLRQIIMALMNSYGDSYPLLYIYIRENLSHVSDRRSSWSKHMRKINHEVEDAIIAVIEEGYRNRTLRYSGPPRVVAYGVLGIIGWTHRWFRPDKSDVSAREIGEIYANMILSGLEAT
jgi:TetR/AcrR family transcriptional regulator, cholesterol catabolism regulator